MPELLRRCLAILTATLFLCPSSFAFQSPLSDEDIRDAYFLGQRHDEATARAFLSYVKTLPPPKAGPYVSEVELYTPYSQLVEWSRLHSVGYSAQQAKQDYRAATDSIFVRLRIDFTASYGAFELYRSGRLVEAPKSGSETQPPNYDRDFRAGLAQKGQWIEPLSIRIVPTGWPATGHVPFSDFYYAPFLTPSSFHNGSSNGHGSYRGYGCCFIGWYVWLQYDARDLISDDATVEVFTTDGQHLAVPFNLSRLR
jgi:hypothetical protein